MDAGYRGPRAKSFGTIRSMSKIYKIKYEGRIFQFNGKQWFDVKTYAKPPLKVVQALNERVSLALEADDDEIRSFQELLETAKSARDAGQSSRAQKLVRRALDIKPEHEGALAIYCSLLRRRGAAEKALKVSEPVRFTTNSPLLVTRAAALCDLGRWDEAKKTVGQALAIGGSEAAAFKVVNRIKAHRPDLYEKN